MSGNSIHPGSSQTEGWLSRERSLALVLVIATGVIGYLCYRLIVPFLPALAWALALAVMAHPLHHRIKTVFPNVNISAALCVLLVALLIVAPALFVTQHLAREGAKATTFVHGAFVSGRWHKLFEKQPALRPFESWAESQLGLEPRDSARDESSPENSSPAQTGREDSSRAQGSITSESADLKASNKPEARASDSAPVQRATAMLTNSIGTVLSSTGWIVMQLLITFMTLFYFFRDRQNVLRVLRSLLPLTQQETDEVFARVDDTIHATIFGSVAVAIVQGAMGGLMFWFLGLPSPLLWGAVMALLAVIPVLGTFVIWMPAAALLAFQGEWMKAMILAGWGALAIGLIDNLLYPFLVGKRLRLHTLPVFFAIVGGISFFGTSGIILGPLVLASADALLEIWRRRTAFGGTIEEATET